MPSCPATDRRGRAAAAWCSALATVGAAARRASSPPPGSSSSPSAGCASSACSPRSAPPSATCAWSCWPTARWSASSPPSLGDRRRRSAAWMVVGPRLEAAAGHRIDRLRPAVVADRRGHRCWPWPRRPRRPGGRPGRWPGSRSCRRCRPDRPEPQPAHRSALVAGAAARGRRRSAWPSASTRPRRRPTRPLIVAGTVASIARLLLAGPLAIRALAPPPAACRSRPGSPCATWPGTRPAPAAALAAISLGLGDRGGRRRRRRRRRDAAGEGNLSDRQLWSGSATPTARPRPDPGRARAPGRRSTGWRPPRPAIVVALDAAVDRGRRGRGGQARRPVVMLGRPVGEHTLRDIGMLYVATPELLGHLGLEGAPRRRRRPDPTRWRPAFANLANTSEATRKAARGRTGRRDDRVAASSSAPVSCSRPRPPPPRWRPARAGGDCDPRPRSTAPDSARRGQVAAECSMTLENQGEQNQLAIVRSAVTPPTCCRPRHPAMTVDSSVAKPPATCRPDRGGATATTPAQPHRRTSGALPLLGVLLGATGAYLALVRATTTTWAPSAACRSGHLAVTLAAFP